MTPGVDIPAASSRYFAIVRPLCRRLPRKLAVAVICTIWTSSALLSLPQLLYSGTRSFDYSDESTRIVCITQWPGYEPPAVPYEDYVYNVVFMFLTYVVPVSTMAVTYTRMGFVLWGSQCIGEVTELQRTALRNKQKVVRMLITVVTLFSVSWLPYHIYFLFIFHHPKAAYVDYIQHVYLVMYWLAMSHAMYNPLIYYFMNKRFNTYFKRVLCFCLPKTIASKSASPSATGRNHDMSHTWTQRLTLKPKWKKPSAPPTKRSGDYLNGNPVVPPEINVDTVSL